MNHPFRIAGIVEHGKGGRIFLPIHTLGTLIGSPDNASLFYIRSDDLKNQQLIRQEILATPGPRASTRSRPFRNGCRS